MADQIDYSFLNTPVAERNLMSDNPILSPIKATSGMTDLFQNPAFLAFLADLGARIDPTGVGGAVGGATKDYIKAESLYKALGKSGKNIDPNMQAALAALTDKNNPVKSVDFDPITGKIKSLKASDPISTGNITAPSNLTAPSDAVKSKDINSILDEILGGIK